MPAPMEKEGLKACASTGAIDQINVESSTARIKIFEPLQILFETISENNSAIGIDMALLEMNSFKNTSPFAPGVPAHTGPAQARLQGRIASDTALPSTSNE